VVGSFVVVGERRVHAGGWGLPYLWGVDSSGLGASSVEVRTHAKVSLSFQTREWDRGDTRVMPLLPYKEYRIEIPSSTSHPPCLGHPPCTYEEMAAMYFGPNNSDDQPGAKC
jgi:hypothetical protein